MHAAPAAFRRSGARAFRKSVIPLRVAGALLLAAGCSNSDQVRTRILLGTTHTLEDSGILDTIAVQFRAAHPEAGLQIVVAGSGEIMTIARRGDVDVILTHSPKDERAFIGDGRGIERRAVMHNTFVIAGPVTDPARVAEAGSARDAFLRILDTKEPFISRGDDSGTHQKELEIWTAAGVRPDWAGYEESGTGMADVLRVASQRDAYTLSDVATLAVLGSGIDLVELFHGDPVLVNEYSVIVVRDARNAEGAALFADWITSAAAQPVIARFGRATIGRSLFTPGAPPLPAK